MGSGGYAQLHSATVCGMTTAAAMHYGVGSLKFAVCFILSMVVMYDAMGVRRETGKQAKLLNSILLENPAQAERRSFAGEAEGIRWTYAASGGGRCYSWHCSRRVYGAVLLTAVLHGQNKRGGQSRNISVNRKKIILDFLRFPYYNFNKLKTVKVGGTMDMTIYHTINWFSHLVSSVTFWNVPCSAMRTAARC